jgi:hypothetical protein
MFPKFRTTTALSRRDILAVLVVLAVLAGGTGLSWLASSLPKPPILWPLSRSVTAVADR